MTHEPPVPAEREKRPMLCRVGLHRWRFLSPSPTLGAFERCTRCQRTRLLDFASGAYFYEN